MDEYFVSSFLHHDLNDDNVEDDSILEAIDHGKT